MSILDLHADEQVQASLNTAPAPVAPPAKFSAWSAIPRAIGVAAGEVGASAADLVNAARVFRDTPSREIATSGLPTSAYSSELGDTVRKYLDDFRPDPNTASTAEQVLFGFSRGLAKVVPATIVAGPVGAIVAGIEEGMTVSDELRRKGVGADARTKAGMIQGAGLASAALPLLGTTLAETAALYVAGGPGGFMAQQALTREILRDAGHDQIAAGYDPFDPVGLAVASLIPAGFTAYGLRGQVKAARAKAAADFNAGPVPSEPTPVAAAVADAYKPAPPRIPPEVVDAAMVNNLRTFDDFLTVWHGSPYKFDAFDAAHIGKGEGAQAYGHGLYLTATSDVAKSYAAETAFKYGQKDIAEMMYSQKLGDASAAAKSLRKEMDSMRWERYPPGERAQYDAALAKLDAWAKEKPQFGQLYKVALPNSVIAKMLDWDKPLSQQPEVLKALETHPTMGKESLGWRGAPPGMWERAMSSPSRTGEWLYSELGDSGVEQTAAARQAGITGIRYLDGGSRASGEGTYNYVIFPGEEGKLRILEVNGKPSAAPESAAPAPPKTAAEAGDPIAKLNEPADAKPKPAADPIMSTVATRVADLESTAPDMVVRIADDGKHVTLADDLAEVRRMVAEGTDDSLGTLDADLMRVAVECALSTGG